MKHLPKAKVLPVLAKSLWLKDNNYKDNWYSNLLYENACHSTIKNNLYYQITNNLYNMETENQLIKDGKQCSECDVVYERPHWKEVLCVDCFESYLEDGIQPDLPKASGVEL